MSTSAAQAAAFYREVARENAVWALRDEQGFPAPKNGDGVRAMPFWSLRSRVERVIKQAPAYAGFTTVEIPLSEWRSTWLPNLGADGLLVGINWSGKRATGFDVKPREVEAALAAFDQGTACGM